MNRALLVWVLMLAMSSGLAWGQARGRGLSPGEAPPPAATQKVLPERSIGAQTWTLVEVRSSHIALDQTGQIKSLNVNTDKISLSTQNYLWVYIRYAAKDDVKGLSTLRIVDQAGKRVGRLRSWIDGANLRRVPLRPPPGPSMIENPVLKQLKDQEAVQRYEALYAGKSLTSATEGLLIFEGEYGSLDGLSLAGGERRVPLADKPEGKIEDGNKAGTVVITAINCGKMNMNLAVEYGAGAKIKRTLKVGEQAHFDIPKGKCGGFWGSYGPDGKMVPGTSSGVGAFMVEKSETWRFVQRASVIAPDTMEWQREVLPATTPATNAAESPSAVPNAPGKPGGPASQPAPPKTPICLFG